MNYCYIGHEEQLKYPVLCVVGVYYLQFYPRQIPVNYNIYFKKAILSKVKNRLNQDYYSKTYNQKKYFVFYISKDISFICVYLSVQLIQHNQWVTVQIH